MYRVYIVRYVYDLKGHGDNKVFARLTPCDSIIIYKVNRTSRNEASHSLLLRGYEHMLVSVTFLPLNPFPPRAWSIGMEDSTPPVENLLAKDVHGLKCSPCLHASTPAGIH